MIKIRYKVVQLTQYITNQAEATLQAIPDPNIDPKEAIALGGDLSSRVVLNINNTKLEQAVAVGDEFMLTAEKVDNLPDPRL